MLCLSRNREYRKGSSSSVHPSICQPINLAIWMSILVHSSMMARWIFFILGTMIRYHGPLMHVKFNLAFGQIWVMLTIFLYNLNFVILFIFDSVIMANVLLMSKKYHLVLCQIWVIMATFSYILCICCEISEKSVLFYSYLVQ